MELDSSGAVKAVDVFALDGLVASLRGGAWTQYVFDPLGNVSKRLSAAGVVQSSSAYDAYGQETNVGSPTDPFGYNARSGYILDRETGLYLCQHRYYDPTSGRWLNRDPVQYVGGVDLYAYGRNNPIRCNDPSGFGFGDVFGACILSGGATALLELIKSLAGLTSGVPESACRAGVDCLSAALSTAITMGLGMSGFGGGCAGGLIGSLASTLGGKLCDQTPTPCKDMSLNLCDLYQIAVGTVAGCAMGAISNGAATDMVTNVMSQYLGVGAGEMCKTLSWNNPVEIPVGTVCF